MCKLTAQLVAHPYAKRYLGTRLCKGLCNSPAKALHNTRFNYSNSAEHKQ